MLKYFTMKIKISVILLAFIISSLGCATVGIKPDRKLVFYPPLPEEPRIQYLTSFSSSRDIEGEPSGFSRFILGNDTPLKPIVKPYGITLYKGKIYICDTVYNAIEIIDLNEKTFEYFRPMGGGQLIDPINLDFSPDGRMFVADARRGQVLIFSPSGEYLTAIGAKGEFKPTDVIIRDGRIFMCDLKSHSVRVYDISDNTFLYSIPAEKGENKESKLFSPTNLDMDTEGNLYISDAGAFNVKEYTIDGIFLRNFGLHGDTPGQFARPKGVAVDREARVYVVDAAFENVQIFGPEGELLLYFPDPQDAVAGLTLPAGIFIDYENIDYFLPYVDEGFKVEYLIFIANQYGERKISVFGFGKKR